jgi:VanZ family protein
MATRVSSRYLLWALAWLATMAVIFFFSTLTGTATYYEPPFWLLIERKGAHVAEYALLTFVSYQFFISIFPRESWQRVLLIAAAWALMYGATDELHQYFTPFRGAALRDVGIDAGGVLLGILFLLVYKRFSQHRKKEA